MDALTIGGLLTALAAITALIAWRLRVRSDIRRQWQATRQGDWTTDELAALGAEPAT